MAEVKGRKRNKEDRGWKLGDWGGRDNIRGVKNAKVYLI